MTNIIPHNLTDNGIIGHAIVSGLETTTLNNNQIFTVVPELCDETFIVFEYKNKNGEVRRFKVTWKSLPL